MFETQDVTKLVYGRRVDFSAVHPLRSRRADRDLPSKFGAVGELGPSSDRTTKNGGAAVDNSHTTGLEVGFFMKVRDQHRIPEAERSAEPVRPRLGGVDLDADSPHKWLSQIVKFRARRIRTRPVRLRLFPLTNGTCRDTTQPHCYDD